LFRINDTQVSCTDGTVDLVWQVKQELHTQVKASCNKHRITYNRGVYSQI